jgi:hypothetical protein
MHCIIFYLAQTRLTLSYVFQAGSITIKTAILDSFGQYMSPVHSAEGERINWINYKTGEKNIYFRMHADHSKASIAIEITHKDDGVQALYFEQFDN